MTQAQNALDSLLDAVKVSGQILLVDQYQPPWGIQIPDETALQRLLELPRNTRVIPFHIVLRGLFELHRENTEPIIVKTGEVIICSGGQEHRMLQGSPDAIYQFSDMLGSCIQPIEKIGLPGATELVCGVFILQNNGRNPLIEALPAVIHADVSDNEDDKTIASLTQLLVAELTKSRPGNHYMVTHILELLCAESIREYLEMNEHNPGWFKALRDPKIGRAINAIHKQPEAPISVPWLADKAGMSHSRFSARFREVLGESVMSYVLNWRMNLAARLLAETSINIDTIASRVGYENPSSFHRTFAKSFGDPPARWRKRNRSNPGQLTPD